MIYEFRFDQKKRYTVEANDLEGAHELVEDEIRRNNSTAEIEFWDNLRVVRGEEFCMKCGDVLSKDEMARGDSICFPCLNH